jgi:sugar phosphate isomerase/epimerase
MPKYEVNQQAVAHARQLIDARRYVIRSRWQEAQPSTRDQNIFLKSQFAAACDRCAEAGVTVHLEFILWPPIDSLRVAWDVVHAADRPNGGIMFDTWHFCRGDPDLDLLATIPGERIFSVQLSDGAPDIRESLVKDTLRHRLLPGDGVFDLVGTVRTLHAIGGLRLVGPEVMSSELHALPPIEAARRAGEACDSVVGASTVDQ